MRKTSALLVAMAIAALVPAGAHAAGNQVVKGSIVSPTRFTDGTSGWPGVGRRVHITAGEPANGLVAYVFAIDVATQGGIFDLGSVKDATGAADLDICFYSDLGDDIVGDRAPAIAEGGDQVSHVGPGGESGQIPIDATYAIVFTPNGVNSTFTYTGEPA